PHRAPPHGPATLQNLEHFQHPEAAHLTKAVEESLDLAHIRAVGEEGAAGSERATNGRHRLPRFRQVEQNAVEVALLHSHVDVAELELEVRWQPAQRLVDRTLCRLEEILALLVGDDLALVADCSEQGEGESSGAGPRLEHASARVDVGADQDRAEVL